MDNTFEKRKKIIYDLICDDFYVPMKIKEIAMLLQIPRDQREELKEVLDALEERKVYQRAGEAPDRNLSGKCKGIWIYQPGRGRRGCFCRGGKQRRGLSGG